MSLGDPVLNEVALLGDLPAGVHSITNLAGLTFDGTLHRNISVLLEDKGLKLWGGGIAAYPGCIELYGQTEGVDPGAMQVLTPNTALNALLSRIKIAGAADVVDITFANALLKGMKLGASIDANTFTLTGLGATSLGDGVALGFGAGPETKLVWDVTDVNAMLFKIDLPAAAAGDVPALLVGVGIMGVDLAILDTITEPVMGVIDLDRDARVTIGFSADDQPELNFNAISKLLWDVTDIDANLLKVDLPAGGVLNVPVMALGIAIAGVDLTFFNGLTEPVAALVDIAKTSWVTLGFGAAAAPQLNCGGVATEIGCAPRFVAEKQLSLDATTEVTIDGVGAIAITKSFHTVDTNLDGPTDDLDNITGGAEGDTLVLKAEDGARTVVCKHATGNLRLDGAADFSLDNADDSIMLVYDGANWLEIARSNNGA